MDNTEQQFLKELDDKLWKASDKLRSNLDAGLRNHQPAAQTDIFRGRGDFK